MSKIEAKLNSWTVRVSEDGNCLYIDRPDHPGQIQITTESDALSVDFWNKDHDLVVSNMSVNFEDLRRPKD